LEVKLLLLGVKYLFLRRLSLGYTAGFTNTFMGLSLFGMACVLSLVSSMWCKPRWMCTGLDIHKDILSDHVKDVSIILWGKAIRRGLDLLQGKLCSIIGLYYARC